VPPTPTNKLTLKFKSGGLASSLVNLSIPPE